MQIDYSDSFHLTSDQWHQLVMIECSFRSLADLGNANNLDDFDDFLNIHDQLSKMFRAHMERIEVSQVPAAEIEPIELSQISTD